jgi:uncharacterized RDD family membrane protein YckC
LPGNWREEVRDRVVQRRRLRSRDGVPVTDDETAVAHAHREEQTEGLAPEHAGSILDSPPDAVVSPDPSRYQAALADDLDLSLLPAEALSEEPETASQTWSLGRESQGQPAERPVERPATAAERILAAGIDGGLLTVLYLVVGYFAAKVAQVQVFDLSRSALYLASFLLLLGLVYAGYFTGSSGQTIGKSLTGLHVVDTSGHAPGVGVALLRAFVGLSGILLLSLGMLPMLFDPARRALHDRLFKTRVIKH